MKGVSETTHSVSDQPIRPPSYLSSMCPDSPQESALYKLLTYLLTYLLAYKLIMMSVVTRAEEE